MLQNGGVYHTHGFFKGGLWMGVGYDKKIIFDDVIVFEQ